MSGLRVRMLDDLELQQARAGPDGPRTLAGVRLPCGALGPGLDMLLGLPLRVDEVARLAGRRAQQLEAQEARLALDRAQSCAEAALQLGAGALGDLDCVDLHDCHAPTLNAGYDKTPSPWSDGMRWDAGRGRWENRAHDRCARRPAVARPHRALDRPRRTPQGD